MREDKGAPNGTNHSKTAHRAPCRISVDPRRFSLLETNEVSLRALHVGIVVTVLSLLFSLVFPKEGLPKEIYGCAFGDELCGSDA